MEMGWEEPPPLSIFSPFAACFRIYQTILASESIQLDSNYQGIYNNHLNRFINSKNAV